VNQDRARELLAAERRRIERALATLERGDSDELSQVDQHLADTGSELFEEERDRGITERLKAELAAVERAERRLAEGTYGLSIESGEPIPDQRLEAIPTAERTVEEQARLDRGA
jgi:DnaK suppressor protein